MGFESYVFGHKNFKIKDTLLFKGRVSDTTRIKSFNGNVAGNLKTMGYWISICYVTRRNSYNKTTSSIASSLVCTTLRGGGGDSGYHTESTNADGGLNSGGGGGGYYPGGTGSSSNWQDPPCKSPSQQRTDMVGCGTEGPRWIPIELTPPVQSDPCSTAEADIATNFSKTSDFTTAKTQIKTAAVDGNEHEISFGKDANSNVISTTINTGNNHSGAVTSIANQFADLHNHPDNTPPSSGDLYGFIDHASTTNLYQTRYVVDANGTVYALVITDLQAAKIFNAKHPRQPGINGYAPSFPETLVDEIGEMKGFYQATDEMAVAFILEKYHAGVALLKQDSNGNFKRLNTYEATDSDGRISYTQNICP